MGRELLEVSEEVNKTEMLDIIKQLTRLETKIDMMGNVRDVANEALTSTKSAHYRIDKIDRIIFWAGTVIIGGVILGAIGLLFQFAKN